MQFDARRRREFARQSGEAILDRRDEALKYLADAEARGNRDEARKWESHVRSINKLVAEYGFDRRQVTRT